GLANVTVNGFLAVSQSDLFAATGDMGVYRSTDGGQSWAAAISGLNHPNVTSLARDDEGYLYAGTDGGGVYRSTQAIVVGVKDGNSSVPLAFQLSQNYPNPFNPTTVIRYQVPTISDVNLVVYDILGRVVSVLVNEKQSPGTYDVSFNATGLSSGVYLYRLTAGSMVVTKRMVILK
ncbi:MAG: T9SS type A sorting domain-containing protein, partial [Methanoregulaceae archaeon]|nr:T9SS type A sorting domain-containing protein [Methanoregulaceae archaeon]